MDIELSILFIVTVSCIGVKSTSELHTGLSLLRLAATGCLTQPALGGLLMTREVLS